MALNAFDRKKKKENKTKSTKRIEIKMVTRKPRFSNTIGPTIIHFCRGQNQKKDSFAT